MLVSDKLSFLFIHIQKTAGTSVTHSLTQAVPDLRSHLRPHDPLHMALQASDGEQYRDYLTAAFVRNPFDRMVSWYSDITMSTRLLSPAEKIAQPNYNRIRQHVLENSSSFDEFIEHCAQAIDRSGWKPFLYNQADYLTDEQGRMAADFIGRFETLNDDFAELCVRIGLPKIKLSHRNRSKRNCYRNYYTDKSKKIIAARFEKDCDLFGYSF